MQYTSSLIENIARSQGIDLQAASGEEKLLIYKLTLQWIFDIFGRDLETFPQSSIEDIKDSLRYIVNDLFELQVQEIATEISFQAIAPRINEAYSHIVAASTMLREDKIVEYIQHLQNCRQSIFEANQYLEAYLPSFPKNPRSSTTSNPKPSTSPKNAAPPRDNEIIFTPPTSQPSQPQPPATNDNVLSTATNGNATPSPNTPLQQESPVKSRKRSQRQTTPSSRSPQAPQSRAVPSVASLDAGLPEKKIIKQSLDPHDIEAHAVNDTVVGIKDDKLGFEVYAEALSAFITSQYTLTPLTISINGSWGQGKSSLMNMLKQKLEPLREKDDKHYESPTQNSWNLLWQGLAWRVCYIGPFRMLWLSKMLLRLGGIKDPKNQKEQEEQKALLDRIVKRLPMTPNFHPTVWFNAWKFGQEEQIWAALASEVLEQLAKKYPWPLRLLFWLQLTFKRSKPLTATGLVLLNSLPILLTVLLAIATAIYPLYILPLLHNLFPRAATTPPASSGGFFLLAATVISAVITGIKASKTNPFKIPLKKVFNPPNYEEKIGFIGRFEEDFKHIVEVTTWLSTKASKTWEPQKLVIFIDDLDRCRPLQAVSIVEAISLLLDSEQCVFIIGMDSAAVATSIEAKYKELTYKMRRQIPGIVSPGNLFLEKIIQISFNIPQPSTQEINLLIDEILNPKDLLPTQQPAVLTGTNVINVQTSIPQSTIDVSNIQSFVDGGFFKREDVQNAIKNASKLLQKNPRQVKRFINQFRLKVYVANKRNKLFGETLESFAMLVVWSMRWPEVVNLLLDEVHSSEVYAYLMEIGKHLQDNGEWKVTSTRRPK